MLRRLITSALVMALTLAWASSAHATPFSTWKSNYIHSHDIHFPRVPDNRSPQAVWTVQNIKERTHEIWVQYVKAQKAWHLAHRPRPVVHSSGGTGESHSDRWGTGAVQNLIRRIFGGDSARALCTAYRESRFHSWAYNPSGAAGVFQIMPIWYRGRWHFDPFNAYLNIYYAHKMVVERGWRDWNGGCI